MSTIAEFYKQLSRLIDQGLGDQVLLIDDPDHDICSLDIHYVYVDLDKKTDLNQDGIDRNYTKTSDLYRIDDLNICVACQFRGIRLLLGNIDLCLDCEE